MADQRRIELDGRTATTASVYAGAAPAIATLVLAHGAGANQFSPFMVEFAGALAARHLDVVTFNFPFTERGKKLPDPQPVLEACYRSVLAHVATEPARGTLPIIIGGKSLGGRIASHVAAARDADEPTAGTWWNRLRGLVFLGYPLHPPDRPAQLRAAHLPLVRPPMLFVQGERDPFGTPAELAPILAAIGPRAELLAVPGRDHSLGVPARGRLLEPRLAAFLDPVAAWVRAVGGPLAG